MLNKIRKLITPGTGDNTVRSPSDMKALKNDLHSMTVADLSRASDAKLVLDLADGLVQARHFTASELEKGLKILYNYLTADHEFADFSTIPLPHLKARLEVAEKMDALLSQIHSSAGETITNAVWQMLHILELFKLDEDSEEE